MIRWIPVLAAALLAASCVPALAETVATVGSTNISREDLDKHVSSKISALEDQRFEILNQGVEELITQQLVEMEAKTRGVTVEELGKKEIEAKIKEPTDAEIKKVYEENKEDLEGATLESVKQQLVDYIKQNKQGELGQKFIAELKKKYKTTNNLKPPKVDVSDAGRPSKGPASAPVTIIEFSDYECPFCKRAEPAVEQVVKTYGDKVRLVYRNFPLPMHQNARPAAEAAACANAQGKFWEYHAKLFAADTLSTDKYKAIAKETGLAADKFDECLTKKPFGDAIDKDMADGSAAGVSGTPAFFINGRKLSGAQPFEKFKELIDDELNRAGKS